MFFVLWLLLLCGATDMARGFFVNGEALVTVKGNGWLAAQGTTNAGLWELGLADDKIFVAPRLVHKDLKYDDYGDEIPPEVIWALGDCTITMTLIHFDPLVLRYVLAESMAGAGKDAAGNLSEGTYAAAGTPMGGWNAPGTPGCHYISLGILSQQAGMPWRFPTAYLPLSPLQWPLGTEKSIASLTWRAIAYGNPPSQGGGGSVPRRGELVSAGQVLWDHNADTGSIQNARSGHGEAPVFIGPNSATVPQLNAFSVRVQTVGVPVPSLTATNLPAGVTFSDLGNGCGVLTGGVVFAGTYSISLKATNSLGTASEAFTLNVV